MPEVPEADADQTTVQVGRWPLVFFMALVVVLLNVGPLPLLDAALVSLVVVLLPILAVVQLRALDQIVVERIPAYVNSMGTIVFLGLCALGLGVRRFGWEGVGLGPIEFAEMLAWSAGLTVAGMGLMFGFLAVRMALGWSETPFLDLMIPRTPREKQLFVGVSLTAGLGEELVYRGYLLPIAWELLPGVWFPVVVCAALFGLVHAYQGWFGMVRTAAIGLVLSLSMIFAGTLWPAIVAHTVIDLLGGIVFSRALTAAPRSLEVG